MPQEFCIGTIEEPVTFQVGMIAADGWIIASDTRESRDAGTMQLSSSTGKIYHDDTVALTFSGDEWARRIRDQIVEEIKDASADQRAVVGKQRLEIWNQIPAIARGRTERKLLFGSANDLKHLYEVTISDKIGMSEKRDFVTAGHLANPAHFFIQHYYMQKARTRNTVDQLILLAAHTIVQGARHNNRVDGLEIVVCRSGDGGAYCERISDAETEHLIKQSETLDEQLAKLLGVS